MRVTFLGHSCFQVSSALGRVLFDPFLTGNPLAAAQADEVTADAILLTHGHGDHVGDTVAIAERLGIPAVAVYELASRLGFTGIETRAQHIGGAADYPFGRVKFVPACHGSGEVDEETRTILYNGNPAGILYTAEGRTVYHLGDTGLSCELELVGRRHALDLALVPIGDHFTMGPEDAAEAVRMLGVRRVVPCHYNTFPPIEVDPSRFVAAVGDAAEVVVLAPGQSLTV